MLRKHLGIAFSLTAISLAFTAIAALSCSAAHANGFATDTSQLPDASVIHPSRRKIEVVDMTPEVTDHRHPKENTIYQINVGPPPQGRTNVVQIGNPAAGQSGSNVVPILQNDLPFAGSHSNISPSQSLSKQLPTGTSTSGLRGTMAKPNLVKQPPGTLAKPQMGPSAKPVATYAPSSTASNTIIREQSATGTIHGSMLHPKN